VAELIIAALFFPHPSGEAGGEEVMGGVTNGRALEGRARAKATKRAGHLRRNAPQMTGAK
jgi:hypothetical protein